MYIIKIVIFPTPQGATDSESKRRKEQVYFESKSSTFT